MSHWWHVLCFTFLSLGASAFFVHQGRRVAFENHAASGRTKVLFAKKKLNFAEKKKRRAKKKVLDNPASPNGLTQMIQTKPSYPTPTIVDKHEEQAQNLQSSRPDEESKAKALVQAQRASVTTLTFVKERVERLSQEEIHKSFIEKGYYCADGLLQDDVLIRSLIDEGKAAMQEGSMMTPDVLNLGSGDYICSLVGGVDQYKVVPRTIEWVVSLTKHLPGLLPNHEYLDANNCIANLRTFDSAAQQASRSLLQSDDVPQSDNLAVLAEGTNDQRRIALRYYLSDAGEAAGGGVEFRCGHVKPKRDRLVVWDAKKTPFYSHPWDGEIIEQYTFLELALVEKM